jgi:hypothetical protein
MPLRRVRECAGCGNEYNTMNPATVDTAAAGFLAILTITLLFKTHPLLLIAIALWNG